MAKGMIDEKTMVVHHIGSALADFRCPNGSKNIYAPGGLPEIDEAAARQVYRYLRETGYRIVKDDDHG